MEKAAIEIRSIMQAMNISQRQLAGFMGIEQSSLSRWLDGGDIGKLAAIKLGIKDLLLNRLDSAFCRDEAYLTEIRRMREQAQ